MFDGHKYEVRTHFAWIPTSLPGGYRVWLKRYYSVAWWSWSKGVFGNEPWVHESWHRTREEASLKLYGSKLMRAFYGE